MDLKSLFGSVSIGKDTSGNFKMSLGVDGIRVAVRAPDGQFYAKDGNGLKNVTGATIDAFDGFVFKMPVSEVREGDIIVVSEGPFSAVFVEEIGEDGQIIVLDSARYSSGRYVQPTNLFGQRYFVKAVPLFEAMGGLGIETNLLLPLLLSRRDRDSGSDKLLPLLLMQQLQGGARPDNPLLLALPFLNDESDGLETMLLLQAFSRGAPERRWELDAPANKPKDALANKPKKEK